MTRGQRLRADGFDKTKYDRSLKAYFVSCSQCRVLVVNRVPTHEHGCPNQRRRR